ncbi:MAG: hypothetical protein EX271_01070 [Acidimicrobiales bacterium]|nr:hypothetical protein [Hyphomonadaceae bacterium]RZV44731.1 MAG: hypothetical protein EX271_01070 [Acidimicrobiales bacterium]
MSAPTAMAQSKPVPQKNSGKSSTARIVEDVPNPRVSLDRNLIRVNASKTPSGFPVPRYVSLKYSNSNGRTGPSSAHPVAWNYKRRGLPMIVVAETEQWRKVRDVNGDESWMKRRLLDGRRMVLARTEIILRAKPRSDSKGRAIAAKGALLDLEGCEPTGWCRVESEDGRLVGYALQNLLWGAEPL